MTSTGCRTATRRTSGTTRRSSSSSPAPCTGAPRRSSVVQPGRVVQLFSALCVIGIAALTFAPGARALPGARAGWRRSPSCSPSSHPCSCVPGRCSIPSRSRRSSPPPRSTSSSVRSRRERLGWGAGLLAGGAARAGEPDAHVGAGGARGGAARARARTGSGGAIAAGVRALAGVAVAAAALVVPWLVVKAATYGSPLAYSRPVAEQWRQHGRPASFWLDLSPVDVARRPVPALVPQRARADGLRRLVGGLLARVARAAGAARRARHPARRVRGRRSAGSRSRGSPPRPRCSPAWSALAARCVAPPRRAQLATLVLSVALLAAVLRRLPRAVPEAGRRQHQGALRAERGPGAGRRGRVRSVLARCAWPPRRSARGARRSSRSPSRRRCSSSCPRRAAATVPAMRYVVTGAAGFIGSHLREALEASGHDVVAVDSLTDYYEPARKLENLDGRDLVEVDLAATDVGALLDGVDGVVPPRRAAWRSRELRCGLRPLRAAEHRRLGAGVRSSSPRGHPRRLRVVLVRLR